MSGGRSSARSSPPCGSKLRPGLRRCRGGGRALFDYLGRLPAEQRRGVWPERLRLGVATRAEGYLDASRAAVQARLGGTRVHGRVVELVPLTEGETDLLAIVAPPAPQVASVTAVGMPVLFPLGQLSGAEDPGLVRDFLPSAADVRHSIARHLAEGPRPSDHPLIVVIDAPALVETPERVLMARHAQIAGAVLGEILKAAGRDLTRARLMTAFETAWMGDLQLDYAAAPLTGTERLLFFQAQ